jgi:hypothetical protein
MSDDCQKKVVEKQGHNYGPGNCGDPSKHKWRSAKRFQYMIISKCIHCGCLRQKIDLYGIKYLYDPLGTKTSVEPQCKVSNDN